MIHPVMYPKSLSLTKEEVSFRQLLGVALLTQGNFKLPRAQKKTISDWCRGHDILWAEGPCIPDEWWGLKTRGDYVKLIEEQKWRT
jgi:hypothetical protein